MTDETANPILEDMRRLAPVPAGMRADMVDMRGELLALGRGFAHPENARARIIEGPGRLEGRSERIGKRLDLVQG